MQLSADLVTFTEETANGKLHFLWSVTVFPRLLKLLMRGGKKVHTYLFLEISQNSQENTCTRVSFLIKLKAEIFKNTFFTENLGATASGNLAHY